MNEYRRCRHCGMSLTHEKKCPHCGADTEKPVQSSTAVKKNASLYKVLGIAAGGLAFGCILVFGIVMMMQYPKNHEPNLLPEQSADATVIKEDETSSEKTAEASQTETAEDLQAKNGIYSAGEYCVGTSIPAGTYIAVEESSTGLVLTVSADEAEETEYYCYPWVRGSVIFTVEDGQYLHATNCHLYDAEKVELTLNPFQVPGMFRVGTDIEPGTYHIKWYGEYGPRICEVYTQLTSTGPVVRSGSVAAVVESGELTEETTVTLQEGDILYLKGCVLQEP